MIDKDLSALIRMAVEAERLETPAPVRFEWARGDGASRKEQVRKMIAGVATLAAAACLGFAALTWMQPATVTPGPVAVAPLGSGTGSGLNTEIAKAAVPGVIDVVPAPLGAVLLAVFTDAENNCSCIQLNAADFQGKLASLGSAELIQLAKQTGCHEDPQRVLVIAMEGPRDQLPSSTIEAEMLASAVRENTPQCGDDACFTETTAPFLSADVRVVAGSVALR